MINSSLFHIWSARAGVWTSLICGHLIADHQQAVGSVARKMTTISGRDWSVTLNGAIMANYFSFLCKVDSHYDHEGNPQVHGFKGPMKTESVTSSGYSYPLQKAAKEAGAATSVLPNPDFNSENPVSLLELVQNCVSGIRQMSGLVYLLKNIRIMTETLIKEFIIKERDSKKVATAVEVVNNRKLTISHETFLSAGGYDTPQVLMLSEWL
jgi:choline dehydrogenase-like flavoprotein